MTQLQDRSLRRARTRARLARLGNPNRVFWESSWNSLVLQLAVLSLLILAVLPAPPGLGQAGFRTLGIFVVCFSLWISAALPFAITGLLALSLLSLYRVLPSSEVFSLFGNSAVFFILGAFILAAAIMKSGLSKRVALWILSRFGRSPGLLLFGVITISWFFSLLMSEHAVAAALLPVILELVAAAERTEHPEAHRYSQGLLLAMTYGTVIGGTGTLLGGARAPLAIAILQGSTGETLGFFEWSRAVFPVTLGLLPIGFLLLYFKYGRGHLPVSALHDTLSEQTREQGAMSSTEWGTAGVFLATVAAWVLLGHQVDLATVAILSAVSLFVFRLVSWRDTEEYVNWGILLMYGGAIAVGQAMSATGAAPWLAHHLLSWTAGTPFLLLALLALIAGLLTEGMSSAAVVALLLPLGIGLAGESALAGTPIALAIALAAGLVFIFPTGAPAVALVLTSGRLTIRDMATTGLVMFGVSWALIVLTIRFWWPYLGVLSQ
ncbi:MAG: DASS family sodium-coupled anion symporter [Candidatus Eisenbacteria bacterium]|uniref:DASS family sodium-coupled anion symporter n=1 Tax=Eiseniibacteriota bacterium TaxID=2212470 RepID=A0A956N9L8_UNCEI|nr:DASS family sodium-coupled anion symporter [Candidatus Eisenbacteria bacterium]MCB9463278.1 DASS family sodium-coupled anion symporter [Candidatus Eisenbacteria bacterium]